MTKHTAVLCALESGAHTARHIVNRTGIPLKHVHAIIANLRKSIPIDSHWLQRTNRRGSGGHEKYYMLRG